MIALMDLRPGNYVYPAGADGEANTERNMRVVALDLMNKTVTAKEDFKNELETFTADQLSGCPLDILARVIGGLSFDEHSLLISATGAVLIVHENGSSIALPQIRAIHQFQNLFRSLTGEELPFNMPAGMPVNSDRTKG